MLDFRSIVKFAEKEVKPEGITGSTKQILDAVLRQVNIVTTLYPEIDETQVVNKITNDVLEYLKKINDTDIVVRVIEYYLDRKLNLSSGYNLEQAYKDVCQAEKQGKLNIDNVDSYSIEYGYELDEDLRRMVIILLKEIRPAKKWAKDWIASIYQDPIKRPLLSMTEKQRRLTLRSNGNSEETIENLKEAMKIYKKSELEILKEEASYRTRERIKELKQECISKIVESIRILDSIGLLEEYKDSINRIYSNHRLSRYQYSTDEIKQLLSAEYLKTLSVEQLIALSSFWINRVNKILPGLNKSRHIVNHLLYECTVWENGKKRIEISAEYLKAIELKNRVIHKIFLELFQGVEELKNKDPDAQDVWIKKEIKKLCQQYSGEYRRYFDGLLPHIENSLADDLFEAFYYENTIYNSYKVKNFNMEAILISLLNNNLGEIENFGYIKEDEEDIGTKKFVLVGIDLQGMNMPLRLHINRNLLEEILKQSQNGSTLFPIYRGRKDFEFSSGAFIPTHIYVPMSSEKKKQLQGEREKAEGKVTSRTKKTIDHLCYISCKENMPEHMKPKSGPRFIDVAGTGGELEK